MTNTSSTQEPQVNWSQDQMVEVLLNEPDDFLKVRETLNKNWCSIKKRKETYTKVAISCTSKEDII